MTDREKLIDLTSSYFSGYRVMDMVDYLIDNGVTVQKHGRWKNGNPYCPVCGKDKFSGLDADVWADWKPDYCPNCGSKMIGE